jgi:hypothetical protein
MITVYNTASAFYWYPVKFNLQGGQMESFYRKYTFNNGIVFNGHNFLYQAMDYADNNNQLVFLTDMISASEVFSVKEAPKQQTDLTQIISTMSDSDGFIIKNEVQYLLSPDSDNIIRYVSRSYLKKMDRKSISDVDILKFTIDETDEDLIFIENENGQVLTCNSLDENETYFDTKIQPYVNKQRFEFFLSDDGQISFFLAGSNNKLALTTSSITNNFILTSVNLDIQQFRLPNNLIFNLNSYNRLDSNSSYIPNSKLVEYNNSPIDPIETLRKDDNVFDSSYIQNYLMMSPAKSPKIFDDEAIFDVEIAGLKNYQNPDYDYTKGPFFIDDNPYIRRIYWQLHTGTNQDGGYDNIYLSYTSNSTKLSFLPDRETEFQYSPASPRVPLSGANLIESGTIAGEHPLTSDRVHGLSQNYKNTLPATSQPTSFFRETGTWLCSWLKGTQTGEKVWYDRYYNAAYYTADVALSSQYLDYVDRLDPSRPYVYDMPSTLVMEPGARYKYFRQGINSSKKFLEYLDYTAETRLGSKILHVSAWNNTEAIDVSPYKNSGIIINRGIQGDKNYHSFYGNGHIIFPAKSDLLETQKLTVSLWLYVNNWNDINGWQIFGNYYEGGWGLFNDGGQIAPLLTLIENKEKRSYTINYRTGLTSSYSLSAYKNASFDYVIRLQDFNYWLVDTFNMALYKFDNNGKLLVNDSGHLKGRMIKIDQVELDENLNLYFFNKDDGGQLLKLNQLGEFISFEENLPYERIDIRSDNNLVYCESNIGIIDNNDNLWEIVGENLYKLTDYNSSYKRYTVKSVKAYVGSCQDIACDSDNNLLFITKDNVLIKFNTTTEKFEINKKLLDDNVDYCDPNQPKYSTIGILRTPAPEFYVDCPQLQKKLYDIIIVVDHVNFKLYYFQTSGQLIKRTDLRSYIENEDIRFNTDWLFKSYGDFTGFNFIRKFGKANSKKISWKFAVVDPLKKDFRYFTLSHIVSSLPNGWHNFSMSFDNTQGKCDFYIDSIKVSGAIFPKDYNMFYDYSSPLLLGATTVKNTNLNDVVKIEDNYKFIGRVSDLRIYNKSLNSSEIEQLYFSNPYSIQRGGLSWNIAVGERDYIEKINHFFKYQLPGSKTNYYNINIHNFKVSREIKDIIESAVRHSIQKISPYNTHLNKINWI